MMKRFYILMTAAALCAAALTGCGSASSASSAADTAEAASSAAASSAASDAAEASAENGAADLDAALDELLAANPISNRFEIAAMNIEYDFMIPADDVVSYRGVKSNDNGDAGLVLVIEPAAGSADSVIRALEDYKETQTAYYGNYPEFAPAQANVPDAVGAGNDALVVMATPANEADAAALAGAVSAVVDAAG